jgi:hypothetical protein
MVKHVYKISERLVLQFTFTFRVSVKLSSVFYLIFKVYLERKEN